MPDPTGLPSETPEKGTEGNGPREMPLMMARMEGGAAVQMASPVWSARSKWLLWWWIRCAVHHSLRQNYQAPARTVW